MKLKLVDFTFHPDFDAMGAYGDCEIYICPRKHETLGEIYATITHECIHFCLDKIDEDLTHNHREETLIKRMQWVDEYV